MGRLSRLSKLRGLDFGLAFGLGMMIAMFT